MSNDIFMVAIVWFLIMAVFLVGMGFAISYHVEHYQLCWNCKEQIDKQSTYCTHCGVDLTPVCPSCGAECYTSYCGSCGFAMNMEG